MTNLTAVLIFSLSIFFGAHLVILLAGIGTLLGTLENRRRIWDIKQNYGIIWNPVLYGAVLETKRWHDPSMAAQYWSPISDTIIYGYPAIWCQFIVHRDPDVNLVARRKAERFNKILSKLKNWDQ